MKLLSLEELENVGVVTNIVPHLLPQFEVRKLRTGS